MLRRFAGATLVLAVTCQKIVEANIKLFSSADSLKAEENLFCLNYLCTFFFQVE